MKKYYSENKDKFKNYNFKKKYNITPEQLANMYEQQDNCCKICNTHKDELKRGLFVDHDHKTLEVRGLLCLECNTGIGMLKDNTDLLDKAKEYLKTKGKFN